MLCDGLDELIPACNVRSTPYVTGISASVGRSNSLHRGSNVNGGTSSSSGGNSCNIGSVATGGNGNGPVSLGPDGQPYVRSNQPTVVLLPYPSPSGAPPPWQPAAVAAAAAAAAAESSYHCIARLLGHAYVSRLRQTSLSRVIQNAFQHQPSLHLVQEKLNQQPIQLDNGMCDDPLLADCITSAFPSPYATLTSSILSETSRGWRESRQSDNASDNSRCASTAMSHHDMAQYSMHGSPLLPVHESLMQAHQQVSSGSVAQPDTPPEHTHVHHHVVHPTPATLPDPNPQPDPDTCTLTMQGSSLMTHFPIVYSSKPLDGGNSSTSNTRSLSVMLAAPPPGTSLVLDDSYFNASSTRTSGPARVRPQLTRSRPTAAAQSLLQRLQPASASPLTDGGLSALGMTATLQQKAPRQHDNSPQPPKRNPLAPVSAAGGSTSPNEQRPQPLVSHSYTRAASSTSSHSHSVSTITAGTAQTTAAGNNSASHPSAQQGQQTAIHHRSASTTGSTYSSPSGRITQPSSPRNCNNYSDSRSAMQASCHIPQLFSDPPSPRNSMPSPHAHSSGTPCPWKNSQQYYSHMNSSTSPHPATCTNNGIPPVPLFAMGSVFRGPSGPGSSRRQGLGPTFDFNVPSVLLTCAPQPEPRR